MLKSYCPNTQTESTQTHATDCSTRTTIVVGNKSHNLLPREGNYLFPSLHIHSYFCLYTSPCSHSLVTVTTRRPASADRTTRRQFQTTGQPVSRTQASDAMTSWLPRYEVKCVQRRCFQCGSVPFHSDIKGTELPRANILIPLERQLIAL